LRYFPILAIQTEKIAPGYCKRQGLAARIEMLERLFFHWIHMDDARIAIGDAEEASFDVHLGPASSPATGQDNTFMGTRTTLDRAIGQFLIEVGFL
jgi:hypothetical protein